MKKALLACCLLVVGCQPGFGPVDYPENPEPDWILSHPAGSAPVIEGPTEEQIEDFAEEERPVAAIRMSADAMDFHGSKLFDGYDVVFQPLDSGERPVKRLGHLSVAFYEFDATTVHGKGFELMRWHVPASKMAELWQPGFVDEGYQMKFAWGERPIVRHVRMEVRFETLDGKVFTKLFTPESPDQPRYRWLHK